MENNNDILCPSDSKIYEIVRDIMYPIRSIQWPIQTW